MIGNIHTLLKLKFACIYFHEYNRSKIAKLSSMYIFILWCSVVDTIYSVPQWVHIMTESIKRLLFEVYQSCTLEILFVCLFHCFLHLLRLSQDSHCVLDRSCRKDGMRIKDGKLYNKIGDLVVAKTTVMKARLLRYIWIYCTRLK